VGDPESTRVAVIVTALVTTGANAAGTVGQAASGAGAVIAVKTGAGARTHHFRAASLG